jgi:hypothetical protein
VNSIEDIGNAYLTAMIGELVYIIAGPEFGSQEGHTMVIRKALYGLRTSCTRFHEKLANTFHDFKFKPSYTDLDV